MNDAGLLLGVVAAIAATALVMRARTGRSRATAERFSPEQLRTIGAGDRGPRLVLFTAPGCSPCTVARKVLDEVGERHGAQVLSVDVTEHPDLARDKAVWRAPTVFVVHGPGQAVARISGVPRVDALEAALVGAAEVA